MRVSLFYAQLFIFCFNLLFLRSGLLGWEVLFMQFGLKMIKIFKCKNYFIKPIICFVQMLYKAGVGFVVFVFGFLIITGLYNPLPSASWRTTPPERWRKRSVHCWYFKLNSEAGEKNKIILISNVDAID